MSSEISEKLQQFHDNYLSAKEVVTTAEREPGKTVQYLPVFRRVFPVALLDRFKDARKQQQASLRNQYCQARCQNKDKECFDTCSEFYKNSLADGHELIRKIHKEYKIPVIEEQE